MWNILTYYKALKGWFLGEENVKISQHCFGQEKNWVYEVLVLTSTEGAGQRWNRNLTQRIYPAFQE